MAEFKIIQQNGKVHSVLVPDVVFDFVQRYRWHIIPQPPAFKVARNASTAERRNGASATLYLHSEIYKRLVSMGMKRKLVSNETIDHIDHDPLNNLADNLRPATRQAHHQLKRRDNSSGCVGVVWSHTRKKWAVQVADNGKTQRMIAFLSPSSISVAQAGHLYDNFIRDRRGEFAELNFPNCFGETHVSTCALFSAVTV